MANQVTTELVPKELNPARLKEEYMNIDVTGQGKYNTLATLLGGTLEFNTWLLESRDFFFNNTLNGASLQIVMNATKTEILNIRLDLDGYPAAQTRLPIEIKDKAHNRETCYLEQFPTEIDDGIRATLKKYPNKITETSQLNNGELVVIGRTYIWDILPIDGQSVYIRSIQFRGAQYVAPINLVVVLCTWINTDHSKDAVPYVYEHIKNYKEALKIHLPRTVSPSLRWIVEYINHLDNSEVTYAQCEIVVAYEKLMGQMEFSIYVTDPLFTAFQVPLCAFSNHKAWKIHNLSYVHLNNPHVLLNQLSMCPLTATELCKLLHNPPALITPNWNPTANSYISSQITWFTDNAHKLSPIGSPMTHTKYIYQFSEAKGFTPLQYITQFLNLIVQCNLSTNDGNIRPLAIDPATDALPQPSALIGSFGSMALQ